jgi:glycosyltransferase involved in cell wall biosynthesis
MILVIDDGSTDGTAERVHRWQQEHPAVDCRMIHQPQAGLSAARNAGLEHADGSIVAYIDDDAVAAPAWLGGILAAFERFPAAAAVGGQVTLRWQSPRPTWWHDDLDEVFNRFCPADEPTTLDLPHLPYGCNFAVRRDVALRLGGFRTDLGRRDGTLLAGEETDLLLRMIQAGHRVAYWPTAVVEHLALPDRVSRRYILKRAWNHGRSLARIAADYPRLAQTMPGLADCIRRMIRHAPGHRFRLAHWKYWLLRFGYHYEVRDLTRSKRRMVPDPTARAPWARGRA